MQFGQWKLCNKFLLLHSNVISKRLACDFLDPRRESFPIVWMDQERPQHSSELITIAAASIKHFFILFMKIISFWLAYFQLFCTSVLGAPTRLFYSATKSDLKYSFSIVIQIQVLVARRTLVANNNNESKCKWILILTYMRNYDLLLSELKWIIYVEWMLSKSSCLGFQELYDVKVQSLSTLLVIRYFF